MNKNILFLIIIALVAWSVNKSDETEALTAKNLTIITGADEHIFAVEHAQTYQQKQQGLMHREHLDEMAGMIFIYQQPRLISMWMKNTLIPLDMIFIDEQGIIRTIRKNTVPHSLESISSEVPVVAVLEINGGMSEKLNINKGDRVSYENTFTP